MHDDMGEETSGKRGNKQNRGDDADKETITSR